jgi:membrane-bound metal-dependent hydrolase YbcI (DUF457 family)
MPNYPTHARWGRVGSIGMALLVGATLFWLFESPLLAVAGALGTAAATFVGAVFPDIDHHRSIPRQKAVRALRVLVILAIASLVALNFELLVEFVETTAPGVLDGQPVLSAELVVGVGTALVALVAAWAVDPAIGLVTRQHRGWTHSVPVTFVLTGVLVAAVWLGTGGLATPRQVVAATAVGAFFPGILIHLGLDGEIR